MVTRKKQEFENNEVDELDEDFSAEEDEDEEDPTVFKVRNALQPPSSVMYSLGDLFRLLNQ